MISSLILAELLFAAGVYGFVLYHVSGHLRMPRQGKKTAALAAVLTLASLALADLLSFRPLALLLSVAAVRLSYGSSWGKSFDAFFRAVFLSLPVVLALGYLVGGLQ